MIWSRFNDRLKSLQFKSSVFRPLVLQIDAFQIKTRRTFLEPANPSDSRKKYANGIRMKRQRLENRDTRFHRPAEDRQSTSQMSTDRFICIDPVLQ